MWHSLLRTILLHIIFTQHIVFSLVYRTLKTTQCSFIILAQILTKNLVYEFTHTSFLCYIKPRHCVIKCCNADHPIHFCKPSLTQKARILLNQNPIIDHSSSFHCDSSEALIPVCSRHTLVSILLPHE